MTTVFHFFRRLFRIIAILLAAFLLYLNVALYDAPVCDPYPAGNVNVDALQHLYFLRRVLHEDNAGEEMQMLYPEGYVFTHALYALAWCDIVQKLPPESVPWQDGIREVARSLNALDAPAGRRVFDPDLPLSYGAFYRGWVSYTRGRYLALQKPAERDKLVERQFHNECAAIATAIRQTEQPFLESYRNMAWPADNLVCLAALALHDRLGEPQHTTTRDLWLGRIRQHLNPKYGLIPHDYFPGEGHSGREVRGASQSLMLCFLPGIDSAFAREQYGLFRRHFLAYRLGLPGIREYPHGVFGLGDIDSGPVVAGIGGAASIVGIRAAIEYGDFEVAATLHRGVEALLLPASGGGERCYLFGQLPVLDAFMAWSSSSICAAEAADNVWRWKCQAISLLLLVAMAWLFFRPKK